MQGFMAICAFGTKDGLAKVQCITFDHFILVTQNSTRLRNMHKKTRLHCQKLYKEYTLDTFYFKNEQGA